MKAIVYDKYGTADVLKLREVETPVPNDDEFLIKVVASSINSGDHRFMKAEPFIARVMAGLFRPKKRILGNDVAGVVDKTGRNVTEFKPGDEVFGDVFDNAAGAFAEYVCIKKSAAIVMKPKKVSFIHAASVPVAGATALQALRDHGSIKDGDHVLVNGASGSVGTFAVLLAKAFGAEVTGVCSTKNQELVKSLGADNVIDYKKQNFKTLGARYDLIIDIAANITAKDYMRLLLPNGRGVLVGMSSVWHMLGIIRKSKKPLGEDGQTIKAMGSAKAVKDDLKTLGDLIASGKITPAIDRIYPLEETREAMRYFDEEHASAKVIINVCADA